MSKPIRSLGQEKKSAAGKNLSMHKQSSINGIWASESNANFIDVISVAPIGNIEEIYVNEVNKNQGEFPASLFHTHNGIGTDTPWRGDFPYVERTLSLGKQAELKDTKSFHKTTFTRAVSSVGVSAIRVNFTTGGFTQRDNKNRRKFAEAFFVVSLLDDSGSVVKTATSSGDRWFFSSNATSVQLTLETPDGYKSKLWSYRVDMFVKGQNYGVPVSGNWSASTVTELYRDTQTYENIAYCSGKIVAAEVAAKTPKRQYLVEGYKVLVPKKPPALRNGRQIGFTGQFERATSDSYAWNAMAVLTDTKWGAGLPLDKINILSFFEFDKYCSELVKGHKRYSHSQYLIKDDNYFKLAQQIVGAADGKLYEDSTGRIGILIDRKTDNRRIITSYDLKDEKVKRTTVPESKKLNYVEGEFEDKTNNYKKTIIHVEDSAAITKNGLISKKLKLDTCTSPEEAHRMIKKVLVTSQVASSSYIFEVGHNHEDIQIGDVVAIYDRLYSRINYCGKVGHGSTSTTLKVDKRTPIDITGMNTPVLVLDNNRGAPLEYEIKSWTATEITLKGAGISTANIPEAFVSFAIRDKTGIQPTLGKVLRVTDQSGSIQVECVEYNHSIYDHVDNGNPIVTNPDTHIPPPSGSKITGLGITRSAKGLLAKWDAVGSGWTVYYHWRRYGKDDLVIGTTIASGSTTGSAISTELIPTDDEPLQATKYGFFIHATKAAGEAIASIGTYFNVATDPSGNSSLQAITDLGVAQPDGTIGYSFLDRNLAIKWEHQDNPILAGYTLRIAQAGATLEKKITDTKQRTLNISDQELINKFGREFSRPFSLSIFAHDKDLKTTPVKTVIVSNDAPTAPSLQILPTGDMNLAVQSGSLESDVVGSVVYIWKGNDPTVTPPSDAHYSESQELTKITLPDDAITFDGSTYCYRVAWVDTFGKTGLSFAAQTFVASESAMVPEAPELEQVIGIKDDAVKIDFTHTGTWLKRIKAFYRESGETDWNEVATLFNFPTNPATDAATHSFDKGTGSGYIVIDSLGQDTDYEFKTQAANDTSQFSEDSNILSGRPRISINIDSVITDLESIFGTTDPRELIAEGVVDAFEDLDLDRSIIKETVERKSQNGMIVADIERFQAKTEEEGKKSLARLTDLKTVVTTANGAMAQQVKLLETSFENNKVKTDAEISQINKAISDGSGSSAVSINALKAQLNTETAQRIAAIRNLQSVVANNKAVIAQQVNSISAKLNTEEAERKADIIEVKRAVATETSTRTTALQQLTATVSGNKKDIATALASTTAAVGYCKIGGTQSSQETEGACTDAGGTWIKAPFAEAVRRVRISSSGKSVTVGSMYTSYKSLDGQLQGKAVIGVNSSGTFTGMTVVGGTNKSSISFQAGKFSLKDTSGRNVLYWGSRDNKWLFSGHLSAATGSFSGAITAGSGSVIDGAFIKALTVDTIKINSKAIGIPYGFNKVRMLTAYSGSNVQYKRSDFTLINKYLSGNVEVFLHAYCKTPYSKKSDERVETKVEIMSGSTVIKTIEAGAFVDHETKVGLPHLAFIPASALTRYKNKPIVARITVLGRGYGSREYLNWYIDGYINFAKR